MRRGEVLALQWDDIDWNAGLIHVRRNVTFAGNQPHVGTPKTEKGVRRIPIVGMLREHLEPIGAGETYIIGGEGPITEMMFKRTYQRIAKTGKRITDLFVQKMCKEGSPESLENTGLTDC